jgi:hypothetical protein
MCLDWNRSTHMRLRLYRTFASKVNRVGSMLDGFVIGSRKLSQGEGR